MLADVASIADRLTRVRARTFELLAPLDDAGMRRSPDPILSPPLWDLGHIAAYEELWLLQRVAGKPSRHPDLQATYDAFETPRAARGDVAILDVEAARDYLSGVRDDTLELLAGIDLTNTSDPLLRAGAVFEMVAQHEAQHAETVLQALQMLPAGDYVPPSRRTAPLAVNARTEPVRLPGGDFQMGVGDRGFGYDCEKPRHSRRVAGFLIGRALVTNGEHLDFIADGGYARPELWSPEGWQWCDETAVRAPLYWEADAGGDWISRSFERWSPVDPAAPLCHVSWFEADAHARWAGARLPTEAEWEYAARAGVSPDAPFPWGHDGAAGRANLGDDYFAPLPAGALPDGVAPCGATQMIGDVWEWTSSEFTGYPGFRAHPYREYSEVFYDRGYQVLRGGSWATQDVAMRATFRNWDLPQRRQIFAGLRLAWDNSEEM
jgi:gamma-glutamyl hercynylcysteine S-oxide synthase